MENNNSSFEQQVLEPLLLNINSFPDKNAFCINELFYTYKQLGIYIYLIRNLIIKLDQEDVYIGLVANDDIKPMPRFLPYGLKGRLTFLCILISLLTDLKK